MRERFDVSTLHWVKGEIDETLRQARQALEAFVENPFDQAQADLCVTHLHQVRGTLEMVELGGALRLATEMEHLAQLQAEEGRGSEAFEPLMRAILLLPDYLENLQAGQPDNALILLPIINELRAMRGADPLSAAALFEPDLEVEPPSAGSRPPLEIKAFAQRVKPLVQTALVKLIKGQDQESGLKLFAATFEKLLENAVTQRARRWLWVANGFLEGIGDGGIGLDDSAKQLLGKNEQLIRLLAAGGEEALGAEAVASAVKGMLYAVGRSQCQGRRVAALREGFGLDRLLPTELELASYRSNLGGFNSELKKTVARDVLDELSRVKDLLDLFARSGKQHGPELLPVGEALHRIAETLGILRHEELSRALREQAAIVGRIAEAGERMEEERLMEVAAAMIRVEHALRDWGSGAPLERGDDSVEPAVGESNPDSVAEHQRVVRQVMKEAKDDLVKVREGISGYLAGHAERESLAGLLGQLHQVIGSLNMLSYRRVAQILGACGRFIRDRLMADELPPPDQLDTLADAFVSTEYYLEAFVESRVHPSSMLEVAEGAIQRLGLSLEESFDPVPPLEYRTDEENPALEREQSGEATPVEIDISDLTDGDESAFADLSFEEEAYPEAVPPEAGEKIPTPTDQAHPTDVDEEIISIFLDEAEGEFARIAELLPMWRANPASRGVLQDLRRAFHTLKGSGRLVGANEFGDFAWEFEQLLNQLIDRGLSPTADHFSLVERARGVMPQLLSAFHKGEAPGREIADLAEEARRMTSAAAPAGTGRNPAPTLAAMIDPVLKEIYCKEAEGHLAAIRAFLAECADGCPPTDHLVRALHTLAGSSRTAGIESIAGATHLLERYAKAMQAEQLRFDHESLQLLWETTDYAEKVLAHLMSPESADLPEPGDFQERAAQLLSRIEDRRTEELSSTQASPEARPETVVGAGLPVSPVIDALALDILLTDPAAPPGEELPPLSSLEPGGSSTAAESPQPGTLSAPPTDQSSELDAFLSEGTESYLLSDLAPASQSPSELYLGQVMDGWGFPQGEPATVTEGEEEEPPALGLGEESVDLGQPSDTEAEPGIELEPPPPPIPAAFIASSDMEGGVEEIVLDSLATGIEGPAQEGWLSAAATGPLLAGGDETFSVEEPALHQVSLSDDDWALPLDEFGGEEFSPSPSEEAGGVDSEGLGGYDSWALPADLVAPGASESAEEARLTALSGQTPAPTPDEQGKSDIVEEVLALYQEGDYVEAAAKIEAFMQEHLPDEEEPPLDLPEGFDDLFPDFAEQVVLPEPVVDTTPAASTPVPDAPAAKPAPLEADPALRTIFINEATDILAASEEQLLRWSERPDDLKPLESLQRQLHTLKGSARWAGIAPIAELAHALETCLAALLEGRIDTGREVRLAIHAGHGRLLELVHSLLNETPLAQVEDLVTELHRLVDLPEVTAEGATGGGARPAAVPADYDPELLELFLEEGFELLDASDNTLQGWARNPEDRAPAELLQRQLHTLKGGARMAGVTEIGDLGHAVESMLATLSSGSLSLSPTILALLQKAHDRLAVMLEQLRNHSPLPGGQDLIADIEGLLGGSAPAEAPLLAPGNTPSPGEAEKPTAQEAEGLFERRTKPRSQFDFVRVREELLDHLVNAAGEASISRSRIEQQLASLKVNLGEMHETLTRLREQLRAFDIETEAQIQSRHEEAAREGYDEFDPLELDRFTHMQQISRSMMESLSDLSSIESSLGAVGHQAEALLSQQGRIHTELQEGLMQTRMVPLVSHAPRLRRIVRQTAVELGREVELRFKGAEVEMDRHVADRILAPIEHLLRNAIAHGIELPAERQAAGKPAVGTITVAQSREGAEVVIRVSDDGAGINLGAVREKAIARGLITRDTAIGDQELLPLIFESGFSTAESLTQVAGRGVGMDVVNTEVRALNGAISIASESGIGTTFTIRLPVALTVSRALLIAVDDNLFAIPLLSIAGIVRVTTEEIAALLKADHPQYTWLGRPYDILDLSVILAGGKPTHLEPGQKVPLLIAQSGEQRAALLAEHLIGSREVVVKPLGRQLSSLRTLSGATILGDGRIALILELPALMRQGLSATARSADKGNSTPSLPLVLVVDDSITVRRVTTRLLERNGYRVITAKDGVEAVARLEEALPDVVLLDIEMPRMDGYELAAHIRSHAATKHLPLMMITSRSGEKHRQRAIQMGVNVYLAKPYQEQELLDRVAELTEGQSISVAAEG